MTEPHAVVLAGGSGSRFWPASRTSRPKQLLPLVGDVPLIRTTIERLDGLVAPERTWIVTNPIQADGIRAALPEFATARLVVEPEARDTGPSIALAAARIDAAAPGAPFVVLPADHVIEPRDRFHAIVRRGIEIARDDATLVTFGITPTHPAIGYGYIERGAVIDAGSPGAGSPPVWRVARFREKPDPATAEAFVDAGFLWNSGIFVWTARAILAAMDAGAPELATSARRMLAAARRGDGRELEAAFRQAPRTSVDFAVLEHAPHIAVVEADLAWSDVGSFVALSAVAPTDANGNVCSLHGGADATTVDSQDCVVYAEGARTVALLGTRDLVVVAVGDAVLVCPRHRADEIRRVVHRLRETGRADLL